MNAHERPSKRSEKKCCCVPTTLLEPESHCPACASKNTAACSHSIRCCAKIYKARKRFGAGVPKRSGTTPSPARCLCLWLAAIGACARLPAKPARGGRWQSAEHGTTNTMSKGTPCRAALSLEGNAIICYSLWRVCWLLPQGRRTAQRATCHAQAK